MKILPISLLVIALAGCTTTYEAWKVQESIIPPPDRSESYDEPWPAVTITRFAVNDPPVAGIVVTLDLTSPSINLITDAETTGRTVRSIVREREVEIGINASPFHPVRAPASVEREVVGIHVAEGMMISELDARYYAFWVDAEGVPHIGAQDGAALRDDLATGRVQTAVGGFGRILDGGRNVGRRDARHPRSAVGFDAERETLYLMVIDGRQRGHSVGVTTRELGAWIGYFGAYEALNLDGGGSSTLVVATNGHPRVVNRPIHNQFPGNLRRVANHLGVQIR